MVRVGILGATGYTALELIKLLLRHPEVEITQITSRESESLLLSDIHPSLRERTELQFTNYDLDAAVAQTDCVFSCLPHAASAEIVRELVDRGVRVVDFSADYRLNDVATFESWYQVSHPDPKRVGQVAYGIPELFRDKIKNADLVANPGCFPSSALLPLAPLLLQELLEPYPLIVDSKTGISGAGRKANLKFHYPECNESVAAYGIGTHRHMPEIDQILQRFAGVKTETVFTPHLIPMDRGILSTIYALPKPNVSLAQIRTTLKTFYAREPFVRVTDQLPATKDVANTNYCDISVQQSRHTLVIVSALDNLLKGASGAAVQNFNLMFGFPEMTALM